MPDLVLNKERLEGTKPVAGNKIYDLKFLGFKPKGSKKGDSVNFNAEFDIVGELDDSGKQKTIRFLANSKMDNYIQDMVHGMGLPLEDTPAGPKIPGTFNGPDVKLEDFKEKELPWKYSGPLVGRSAKAELVETTYLGRSRNEIKQFICAVTNCGQRYPKVRHSTNLVK